VVRVRLRCPDCTRRARHLSVSLRHLHHALGIWHNSLRRQITVARCEYPARVANEGARRAAANSSSRCLAARSAPDWPRSPNCRAPVPFLAPNIPSALMMLGLNSDALDSSWLEDPPAPGRHTQEVPVRVRPCEVTPLDAGVHVATLPPSTGARLSPCSPDALHRASLLCFAPSSRIAPHLLAQHPSRPRLRQTYNVSAMPCSGGSALQAQASDRRAGGTFVDKARR
jgi:hypothetical protein